MKTDYTEDLTTLQTFVDRFDEKYFDALKLKVFTDCTARDYVGYGATKLYTMGKPKNYTDTKYIRNVNSSMIWLTSDINPNGITGKDDIGRTYSIKLEVMCQRRRKYGRNWYDDCLVRFYGYGRTIDEIMNKFGDFYSDSLYDLYLR